MPLSSRTHSTPPSWLTPSVIRHMRSLIDQLLEEAAITAECRLRWDTEATIRKRKNLPANSFIYQPSNFMASASVVVGIVVGESARQDIALVSLSMPVQSADRFRKFFTSFGIWLLQPARSTPAAVAPDSAEPAAQDSASLPPDAESLALFLMDLQQNAGKVFTRETLESRAARLSAEGNGLVTAALAQGLIHQQPDSSMYHLCEDAVQSLLHPPTHAPAPLQTAPSEFERLRAAVLAARAHRDSVAANHNQYAQQRTSHMKELQAARCLHGDSIAKVTHLEESLATAKAQAETQRRYILRLEETLRALPDASTALAVAETELRSAEAAYAKLVQL